MLDDLIRSIIWGLAKLFLAVTDWIQEIFVFIVRLDFGSSDVVKVGMIFFTCCLGIATTVVAGKNYIKAKTLSDGEYQKGNFIGKIALMGATIAILPQLLLVSTGGPGFLYSTFEKGVTFDAEVVPSTAIISVTAKTNVSSKLADMTSSSELIDMKTIDDKLNDEEDGEYIYFNSIAELFLCFIASIVFVFTEMSLLLSCGSRVFINLFLFIISFIPIASILDEQPKIGEWFRDVVAESLTIGIMLIMTTLIYALMGTEVMTKANPIIQLTVLIIALSAVQACGNIIAKYLNASDLKGNSKVGLGGLMAVKMVSQVVKGLVKSVGQVGSGIADGSISGATHTLNENLSNAQSMIEAGTKQDSSKQNNFFASSFDGSGTSQGMNANYQNENFFDKSNPMNNTDLNFNARGSNSMSNKSDFGINHSEASFQSSDSSNLNNASDTQGVMTAKDYQHNIETAKNNISGFNMNYGQLRKKGLLYHTGFVLGNFAGKNFGNQMFNKYQSNFIATPFRPIMPDLNTNTSNLKSLPNWTNRITNWTKPNVIHVWSDNEKGKNNNE